MTPQEARTITEFLAADIGQEINTTVKVLGAAVGNLAWSPDAKSKNGLALVRHVAVSDVWFLNAIADRKFAAGPDESDACGIHSGADAASKYATEAPAALVRVRALTDAQLVENVDFFGMMQAPPVALLGMALKHSVHHRGQLSAYLRAMGGKVPGIYGPSGDTQ